MSINKYVTIKLMAVLALFVAMEANAFDPRVCFYENTDYGGTERCFRESDDDIRPDGWGDRTSSVKLFDGAKAELYQHGGFGGYMGTYVESTHKVSRNPQLDNRLEAHVPDSSSR